MSSIFLPFAGVLIALLLNIIFFTKSHVRNDETIIYKGLITTNLIEAFLACVIVYVAKSKGTIEILYFLQRLDHILLLLSVSLIFAYVFHVTFHNKKAREIIKYTMIAIGVIVISLILITKMEIYNEEGVINTLGTPTDSLYIAAGIYIVGIIIILIYSMFIKSQKNLQKKFIPLYVFGIFGVIGMLLRQVNPNILFESLLFSYINLIMYFTIENPDLKTIETLNISKSEADRANSAKSDFLASMSHEIRTPLNAITGFSHAILSHENLPAEIEDYAKDIVKSSDTLLEIVGGVLDVSKIESNKMDIIEVLYKPREEFESTVKMARTRIGEKPIILNSKFAEDVPYQLYGDRGNIRKIVTNLLTNAIKYTNEGHILFNVKCINREDISYLIISVQDTGTGIEEKNITKLFTKFERLDVEKNTTAEGTGLGLAITKKLVDLMGGKINVKSQYGTGSIFMVQIPQRIAMMSKPLTDTQVLSTLEIKTRDDRRTKNFAGKKILIVDDNALNLKVARIALKDFNLILEDAVSGEECLNKIKSGVKYDMILMDIMMPRMSGEEAFKILKEDPNFNTPVIALTADAISGSKEKYLEMGFYGYISKPFSPDEIKTELLRVFK